MHRGILNTVVVVLAGTVAPGVNAQARTAQATATARQAPTKAAASMMVAVPRMPNVVGLTVDSATRLLANARLLTKMRSVARRDSSTNAAPRDQVIDQQPTAGTPLPAAGAITLVVAIPVRRMRIPDSLVARVTNGVIIPPVNVATTPPQGPASTTYVPQLVGRNASTALRTLAAVGLRLDRAVVVEFSDLADSGFIYQQHPLPKTRIDTGSFVKIWISLGQRRTPVTLATPNVLDRTLDDADRILRKSRLVVGHVDTIFRAGAGGLVAHQLPEPGDPAHPSDAVALQVAIAPPLITVPSLIGLRRADADATLRKLGLELGQVTPVTGRGSDTSIVRQTPLAQTAVVRGTFVDVDLNEPVIRRRTIVPSVAGLTEASAEQRLAKDGLVLGRVVVSDTGSAPHVVAQQPAANDSAFVNDRVSITLATPRVVQQGTPTKVATVPPKLVTTPTKVATAPTRPESTTTVPLVEVPQVTNISFELARTLIDKAGLTTESIAADTGRVFVVRSQRPKAGSFKPAGTPVTLVLEPLKIPQIPHLIGLKRAAAEAHASAHGFTMSIQNTRRVLLQLVDRVTTQEPDAQTINRGDQVIQVDLTTPLIPPVPAALAFVLLATGTAVKVRDSRKPRVRRRPLTDLSIVLDTPSAAPISISTPNGRMIRTAITFTLESRQSEWTTLPKDESLIAHATTHA